MVVLVEPEAMVVLAVAVHTLLLAEMAIHHLFHQVREIMAGLGLRQLQAEAVVPVKPVILPEVALVEMEQPRLYQEAALLMLVAVAGIIMERAVPAAVVLLEVLAAHLELFKQPLELLTGAEVVEEEVI